MGIVQVTNAIRFCSLGIREVLGGRGTLKTLEAWDKWRRGREVSQAGKPPRGQNQPHGCGGREEKFQPLYQASLLQAQALTWEDPSYPTSVADSSASPRSPVSHVSFINNIMIQLRSKESTRQCRRCGFNPRVRKILLEKKIAAHSSMLAWRIPWTEEPGGLHSMGLQRAGND